MPKLTKAEVLYFTPEVLNPGGNLPRGASCGGCALRVSTRLGEECAFVHKDGTSDTRVSFEKGVCGLYIGGNQEFFNNPVPTVPRSAASYYEGTDVPTHCGNCEYYSGGVDSVGECRKVEGLVKFWGCCNLWESNNGK